MPESSIYHYGGSLPVALDDQLAAAYNRMNGDPVAAANLFLRWAESDSQIAALIPNVVADYVLRLMKRRAKER